MNMAGSLTQVLRLLKMLLRGLATCGQGQGQRDDDGFVAGAAKSIHVRSVPKR